VIWLELAFINLVCAMLLFCAMAHTIAHLCWRERGVIAVLLTILISGQVWLVPQIASQYLYAGPIILYWLWAADWIMAAFGAALLYERCANNGAERLNNARIDGLGPFGVFRWVVLPLVRGTLFLLALLTLLASGATFHVQGLSMQSIGAALHVHAPSFGVLLISSTLAALPLLAIFSLAKKLLPPTAM